MDIRLNPQLTEEHQRLVIKYVERPDALSCDEWLDVLLAFDLLRTSEVRHEGRMMTFGAFYERFVDAPSAERFLRSLTSPSVDDSARGRTPII